MPLGVISPHSSSAQIIAGLFSYLLILLVGVFALVAGLVGYAVVRYRGRAGQAEPAQTFGSRRLEILWTVVPLAIVIVLFALTVSAMARIDAPSDPDRAADLVVTGHQWWWDARYPNGAVAVTEIHIPVGEASACPDRIDGRDSRFLGAATRAQDGRGAGASGLHLARSGCAGDLCGPVLGVLWGAARVDAFLRRGGIGDGLCARGCGVRQSLRANFRLRSTRRNARSAIRIRRGVPI